MRSLGILFSQLSVLLICVVMVTVNVGHNAQAIAWEEVEEISTDEWRKIQDGPSIAADGTRLHAVWSDEGDGDLDIVYRRFNGVDWLPVQEISSDVGREMQRRPKIAIDGSELHVVWIDLGDGDNDIYYRHFDGTAWQPEVEISSDNGTEDQMLPGIAVENGKAYVVWSDEGDGDLDIYYRYFDGMSWQPEEEISTDTTSENQYAPSVAVDGGKVHIAWSDKEEGTYDLYYRCFDGVDWQPEIELGQDSFGQSQGSPSIAAEDGKVHVVWVDMRSFSDPDVYYRYFDGANWLQEEDITLDDPNKRTQGSPSIEVSGDKVHVVWEGDDENQLGDTNVYYKQFDGSDWQPLEEISGGKMGEEQGSPAIGVSGDELHVLWEDDRGGDWDIYYKYFNGTSWHPEEEISFDGASEPQQAPSIALDGDELHAVWVDGGDGDHDIHYAYHSGTFWMPDEEISTDNGTEDQWYPSIAAEGNKVHIVWSDHGDGDYDIYYRMHEGFIWQPEQEISTDVGSEMQSQPSIAVSGNEVHVVWVDEGDLDGDIHYRHYDGVSWQPEQEISTDSAFEWQSNPSIAVSGNKVHVVWTDLGDGDTDIFYRLFDGTTWQPEQEISTDVGTEHQGGPILVADANELHVVWSDEGDGDSDVYYRRFDGMNWQPEQEISTDVGSERQTASDIAAKGEKVHVVWHEQGGGDIDVFHRYFDGQIWRPEQEVSKDEDSEYQFSPSLAFDGTRVHVIWSDEGGGDYDILYRSGIEDLSPPTSYLRQYYPWVCHIHQFNLSWSASDNHGVINVSLFYRYSPDNSTWLDWSLWSYTTFEPRNDTGGKFQFDFPHSDGFYQFYTIATDTSFNVELPPTTPDTYMIVDTKPPTGSILINDGASSTDTVNVSLTLSYADETSGVYLVMYSNDGVWDDEIWEFPSTTKEWVLEGENRTRTVCYLIIDHAGWLSSTYCAEIDFVEGKDEDFGTMLILGIGALVVAVLAVLSILLYFRKRRRSSAEEGPTDEVSLESDEDAHAEDESPEKGNE